MDRDQTYLLDIYEAAQLAISYTKDVTEDQFLVDVRLQDSVIRRLEIIGEAANRISTEYRLAHPELPWHAMVGMRNVLIHEYDDVDLNIVWRTIVDELPSMTAMLAALLAFQKPE